MPLPLPDTAWPPARLATVHPKMQEWSAWLSGDPERLAAQYRGDSPTLTQLTPSRRQFLGRLRKRMFWGAQQTDPSQAAPHRVHIPIAADIATASSALMFGTPPSVTTADKGATEAITRLVEEMSLWETMAAAFTVAAGLGGTYLRATWDPSVPGGAFPTWVDADKASPVWSPYGQLIEVTFVRVLEQLSAGSITVWRHLERHYLADGTLSDAPRGTGLIEHTLWAGTDRNIGRMRTLDEHYGMEGFARYPGALPYALTVSSGSLGLTVEYAKNKGEQLGWRDDPIGCNLGRSDFDQLEGSFDSLDRVWSSLIREIDLAKARVFIPSTMLRSLGAGAGGSFDVDRELYVTLDIPTQLDATLENSMKMSDFPIRVDEHISAANEIQQGILRDAGYSARTFGEDENGQAMTATEVVDRNSRSGVTRASKIAQAGPAIRRCLMKCLAINQSILPGAGAPPDDLALVWPNADHDPLEVRARSIQMLDAAGAASLWMKLTIAYPGLDRDDLLAEYRRIRAEGMANPDQVAVLGPDDPLTPDESIPDPLDEDGDQGAEDE